MKCDYLDCEKEAAPGSPFCSEECARRAGPPPFTNPDRARQAHEILTLRRKPDYLTTLDHFAIAALTGLLASQTPGEDLPIDQTTRDAYRYARAMMAERAK